jgi:hypothetical protein
LNEGDSKKVAGCYEKIGNNYETLGNIDKAFDNL